MAFSHKHNTDDIYFRAVILGFLGVLNDKIFIKNIISDTEESLTNVPFNFESSGDSRFMQDFFLNTNDCDLTKVEGNYDAMPRGIITLESFNIDSGGLVNKWVRGVYTKESPEGNLETYSANINVIPFTFSFSCKIICDTYLNSFKVVQELVKQFYKSKIFNITYNGFRVGCRAKFSEDYNTEKSFQYDYGTEESVYVSFNIEVESYMPVIDESTERHNANRIDSFGIKLTEPRFDTSSNVSPIINTDHFSPYGYDIDGNSKTK